MAAPTYHNSASDPADNGTGVEPRTSTITPPASMSAGDLVVVTVGYRTADPSASSVSNAGGQTWNGPVDVTAGATTDIEIYWCVFDGNWDASPAWTIAAQSGTVAVTVVMHVFRPPSGDTSWAVDTNAGSGSFTSTTPNVITGITPNNNHNVVLACWEIANISTWGTLSGAGWTGTGTAQYRNSTGNDLSLSFAHQLQDTKAATGDVSQIPSTPANGITYKMAWNSSSSVTPVSAQPADNVSTALADVFAGQFRFRATPSENLET